MKHFKRINQFFRSDKGFCLFVIVWFFAIVLAVVWRMNHPKGITPGASRMDLTQFVPLTPGTGALIFYTKMSRKGQTIDAGQAYFAIGTSKQRAGCTVIATERTKKVGILAIWQMKCDKSGFTWWGDPSKRWLQTGLTIPRVAEVGKVFSSPCIWLDTYGHTKLDICRYGLEQGPIGMYTLKYHFESGEEFGLVFSLAKKFPLGVTIIHP